MNAATRQLGRVLLLAAVYFAAARAGLLFAALHPNVSPVWPPTGVAVAALVLLGRPLWPGVALGAFLANLPTGAGLVASLGIAAGNTAEALVAVALLDRIGFERSMRRPRHVVALTVAALLAPLVSATVGVASLRLTGALEGSPAGPLFWLWWTGDALGLLAIAPPILTLSASPWRGRPPRRATEAAGLAVAVATVGVLVFGGVVRLGDNPLSLAYTVFPLVIWAALRFGPAGAALVSVTVFGLSVWATLRGEGPFQAGSIGEGVIAAQVFVAVETISALLLGAVAAWQRDTETRLRTSRQLLSEIQHIARVGGWEWDVAASHVWWSDDLYAIYGLARGDFPGTYEAFLAGVHPDDRERVAATVEDAARRAADFELEHRVVRPDGEERVVVGRGRAVRDAGGRLLRMVGTAQDVTDGRRAEQERAALAELRAAREQAEQSNRLKDEFLATLSHELRTPLNAIVGWASLLQAGGMEPAAHDRAVRTIVKSARVLTQLIGDVLDVSRIAAGKVSLECQPLGLAAAVETAVDAARPAATEKGLVVLAGYDPGIAPELVDADAQRLQQIVGNLLSNAVKFTPRGGRIDVRVSREGDELVLRVRDTGVGIPAAFLPHVFERFRQADSGTSRNYGGLGIGLAIARTLVEMHGGRLEASSEGEGRGAEFTVRLPRLPPEKLGSAPRAGDSSGAWESVPRLDGIRVVAVEDDEDSRVVLGEILERLGARVTLASSAAEGLARVQELLPDVLLSDLEMPHEDGYALMRKVRALSKERGGATPAAAVSAHVGGDERAKSRAAGFELHVGKPVKPAEIAIVVSALARGRHSR